MGDVAALRTRFAEVEKEALETRERIQAERDAARAEALAAREEIVVKAEAIAAKPESQVHWKNDTAELRALLDTWKEAQRSNARIAKDAERELWKRFTAARSGFEKARKHHFAQARQGQRSGRRPQGGPCRPGRTPRRVLRLGPHGARLQGPHGRVEDRWPWSP
ncbi:DUF349 domain-containing protein [Demequina litorisediminis]|uniref:DUF349 domain-containing protein n=1 Tax=Demequina litorisediminis TaxID=1849022 RepID=UPI003D67077D